MKLLNWVWKGSIGTFRVLYLLLAVVIILVAAYVLGGYEFLAKGMWGSDTRSALSMAAWVDKYFPHVPFWYPLAGGGVSITHSYPVFSFYLVALLKRLTTLDLAQTFGVLGFSSVLMMALGIYAFIALRFKNQTAALIASIFYLVSPIAWVWLFDWGFYAEAVSHMFVMPAIIFWDLFFVTFLNNGEGVRDRIYLVLAAVFLSLATLTHFGTGLGLIGFFGFYVLGYTLKEKERKKTFARGALALLFLGVITALLTTAVTFPFYRYSKIAAQAGLPGGPNLEQLKEGELSIGQILSFQTGITEEGYLSALRHISFPAVVSFLAILGVLFSFLSARHLTFALFAIFSLTLSVKAVFLLLTLKYIPWPFHAPFSWRWTFVPLRMILPALAALGAIGIFKIPFFWIRGRFGSFIKGLFASLAGLTLSIFILYQFGYLPKPEGFPFNYGARGIDLRNVWNKEFCFPVDSGECLWVDQDICLAENSYLYREDEEGLRAFEEENGGWCHSPLRSYFLPTSVRGWCQRAKDVGEVLPELCYLDQLTDEKVRAFWQKCKADNRFSKLCSLRFKSLGEQLSPSGWPEFKIVDSSFDPTANPKVGNPGWLKRYEAILDKVFKEDPLARIDFSPFMAGFAMSAPYYNLDRDLSQLYIYTVVPSSLIHRFWGQQIGAFYLDDPFYGKDPNFVNNLARWFGINYVFFEEHTDLELFREGGWKLWETSYTKEGVPPGWVLKFPEENSLVDLSERPGVLVIGQDKVDAYGQVFRLASYGILPYEDAFVVWGKGAVDSYSSEELQNFDVLVLHGYTYKNRQRADELLKDYVMGGGKLFIDTGWQYTTPDWKTEQDLKALNVIPFESLSWKDLGKTGEFALEDEELGGGVDVSKFAPLIYEGQPWGVSTGERADLRDWARVVLSVKDYPLVVTGELGAGKVIWSGMNLFAHAKQKENIYYEEIELLTNLFSWLNEGASTDSFKITYTRDHPDKVEFTVEEDVPNGGFLLWKEAYHPDFHAQLATKAPNHQTTDLPTHRAGPGWVLIEVPRLQAGDKIVYEYRLPLSEKASSAVSFLTLLFLPLVIVEGVLLKERSLFVQLIRVLEEKLYYLFFRLWKKPLGWWGKEEEE